MNKFNTQKGEVTRYGLACGYTQEKWDACYYKRVTLSQASGFLIDVIYYDSKRFKKVWKQTTNFKRARRWYKRLIKFL